MAEQLIEDADAYRVWVDASTDRDPDGPGGWRSRRVEWKPGHEPVERVLRDRAQAALAANSTYVTLAQGAGTTNAQDKAQLLRVTKECTAVIRLLLGLLDTTDGT